jgi:branched-chain amino acid transport system permease protein
MITLAFGQMVFFTASSLAPYGGDDGLTIAARNTLLGFPSSRTTARSITSSSSACSAAICSAVRSSPRVSAASARREGKTPSVLERSASTSTAFSSWAM